MPDLTDMSVDYAMDVIRRNDLLPGNKGYYDTTDDKDAIVYNQDPQPGSSVPVETKVDIYVKKK